MDLLTQNKWPCCCCCGDSFAIRRAMLFMLLNWKRQFWINSKKLRLHAKWNQTECIWMECTWSWREWIIRQFLLVEVSLAKQAPGQSFQCWMSPGDYNSTFWNNIVDRDVSAPNGILRSLTGLNVIKLYQFFHCGVPITDSSQSNPDYMKDLCKNCINTSPIDHAYFLPRSIVEQRGKFYLRDYSNWYWFEHI